MCKECEKNALELRHATINMNPKCEDGKCIVGSSNNVYLCTEKGGETVFEDYEPNEYVKFDYCPNCGNKNE